MAGFSSLLIGPMAVFIIGGEEPAFWDWQLTEPLDLSVRVSVLITDMDSVSAEDVAALKARGVRPMCYISVGTKEDYRDDATAFPDAVLGNPLGDWPGEVYVDIREGQVIDIMKARIDRCAAMGFVGMEPDNMDAFENDNGLNLTKEDALAYMRKLAKYAHSKGVQVAQKNAPELIPDLVAEADFLLLEQCFEYNYCTEAQPYLDAGKDVLVVEYTQSNQDWDVICAQAKELGMHLLLKDQEVTAGGKACAH